MFVGLRRNVAAWFCAAVLIIALPLAAWAMEVQPLVIDLGGKGHGIASTFQVTNRFDTPLPVEFRVHELSFREGGGLIPASQPSNDLLVFPIQAVIEPGKTQNVRVQYVGDPVLARSKSYYVTVAQLPVPLKPGESGIQILYNFQVLVSMAARESAPAFAVSAVTRGKTQAGAPAIDLTVVNRGASYGYLSEGKFRLIERDASGKEVARHVWERADMLQAVGTGIVGPGQSRTVAIPYETSSPTSQLSGEFEYEVRR